MSLTSYRAAPPRVNPGIRRQVSGIRGSEWTGWESEAQVFWFLMPDPCHLVLARPGGDRLSRALRRSTIGAEGFHGRVRDGIGCWPLAIATRPCRDRRTEDRCQMPEAELALTSSVLIECLHAEFGLVAASERV